MILSGRLVLVLRLRCVGRRTRRRCPFEGDMRVVMVVKGVAVEFGVPVAPLGL